MTHPYIKRALWLVAFILLLAVLYYFISIVIYILISMVITLIGRPVCTFLNKWKVGKISFSPTLSAITTLVLFYLVGLLLIGLFIPLIVDEVQLLSNLKLDQVIDQYKEILEQYSTQLKEYGLQINLYSSAQALVEEGIKNLFSNHLFTNVTGVISGLGDVVALLFSVSFISFFFLKETDLITNIINALTPDEYEPAIHRIITDSKQLLRRYFIGLLIQVSLLSTLYFIGFKIIGISNAFLVAFLCGLLNMIPFIGPLIAIVFSSVIVLSLSLASGSDINITATIIGLGIVFLIVRGLDDFVLQPIIFSNSVKAHPVEIFIVILMGARLMGIPGMIIAIPIYTVIRVIAKEFLFHLKVVQRLLGHI